MASEQQRQQRVADLVTKEAAAVPLRPALTPITRSLPAPPTAAMVRMGGCEPAAGKPGPVMPLQGHQSSGGVSAASLGRGGSADPARRQHDPAGGGSSSSRQPASELRGTVDGGGVPSRPLGLPGGGSRNAGGNRGSVAGGPSVGTKRPLDEPSALQRLEAAVGERARPPAAERTGGRPASAPPGSSAPAAAAGKRAAAGSAAQRPTAAAAAAVGAVGPQRPAAAVSAGGAGAPAARAAPPMAPGAGETAAKKARHVGPPGVGE